MFYFRVADCCTDLLCVSYCLVLLYIVSFQPLLVAFEISIYLSIYVVLLKKMVSYIMYAGDCVSVLGQAACSQVQKK